MTDRWFEELRILMERHTGVEIDPGRQYFAESRLSPLLTTLSAPDPAALIKLATTDRQDVVLRHVLEAMLTGETTFFRDTRFYEYFRSHILKETLRRNAEKKSLRLWTAACSTGQEPYSVAMIFDELAHELRGWHIDIVASDISEAAIERAKGGLFNQFEVQRGLPVTYLLRHFQKQDEKWQISEQLRSRIEFQQDNILAAGRPAEPFDIIFCRNVLLYFSSSVRQAACENLLANMAPAGWLCLGSSEGSVIKSDSLIRFDPGHPGIFRFDATSVQARKVAHAAAV